MREAYISKNFAASSIALIDMANSIITKFEAQGFNLTLRQLYYQMVAGDIIPNNLRSYKRLGSILNDARLAGLVDWESIEDRTRNIKSLAHWISPADVIDSARASFRIDKWLTQPYRVEVWVEKDALIDVVSRACTPLDVPFFSCRGYTSQSEMWRAGKRISRYAHNGQTPLILHLGDHDPSGVDMTRDIIDRIDMFVGQQYGTSSVDRLALNWAQVDKYNPPPNPAKLSDSRASGYISQFGYSSWELDALEPQVIVDLIKENIEKVIDQERWDAVSEIEDEGTELLEKVVLRWDYVKAFLGESY